MTTQRNVLSCCSFLERYAWVAGFVLLRTHYFLIVIVGPVFGWR
jgi:hypothetical protein